MKYLFFIFYIFYLNNVDSQTKIKDKIFIYFKESVDYKKKINGNTIFYIKNEYYEEEYDNYKRLINKHMIQPLPMLPEKPIKFYPFHKINEKVFLHDSIEEIKFYNKKLILLEPHNIDIYVVINKGLFVNFHQVTFFKNTIE